MDEFFILFHFYLSSLEYAVTDASNKSQFFAFIVESKKIFRFAAIIQLFLCVATHCDLNLTVYSDTCVLVWKLYYDDCTCF